MAFSRRNLLSGHAPEPPVYRVPQGGAPALSCTLLDPDNPETPLDCVAKLAWQDDIEYSNWAATGGSVSVYAREGHHGDALFTAEATAVDATIGAFRVVVPADATTAPGVYLLEAALLNSAGTVVLTSPGYLEITPSLASKQLASDQLSVPMIRRAMRDAHPRANRVLEECEFSLVEIHDALQQTVEEYNRMAPDMGDTYTTKTFPWPSQAALGVVARLLEMATLWYARNDLQLHSAGLTANDLAKAPLYGQLAAQLRTRWESWAKLNKRQRNINRGWGTVPSRVY